MSIKTVALMLGFMTLAPTVSLAQKQCTTGTLRGQYVFTGRGFIEPIEPGVQRMHYGIFVFDGAGKLSGKQSSSRGGKIGREKLEGTYTLDADCSGTISLEQAKKAVAAAEAESRKNNWNMVIAVLDTGGHLVMLGRMDGVQLGSIGAAQDKAYSAVMYRRPTKVFQDLVAQGGANIRLLGLRGASVLEGGIPIIVGGQLIGAIGVSGHTSEQDAQVAKAGADALK